VNNVARGSAPRNPSVRTAEKGPVLAKRSLQLSAPDAARLIQDAVGAGGELWVTGSGQSMHPTVRNADQVLIVPLDRPARRQDVVLVPYGPRLMLHRVVRVTRDTLQTRGDARPHNDPAVLIRDIVGRAVAVRRAERVTPLILTTRFGMFGLVRFLLWEANRRARLVRAAIRERARSRHEK
jgi:hypothetical protein